MRIEPSFLMKKYSSSEFRSTLFSREKNTVIEFKEYFNTKDKIHNDVYANVWVLAYANLQENTVSILVDNQKLQLSGKVLIFIPPFSVISWKVDNSSVKWMYFSNSNLSEGCERLKCKIINKFDFNLILFLRNSIKNLDLIKNIKGTTIDLSNEYSVVANLKNKIDKNFFQSEKIKSYISINHNYSYFSREFKKIYKISPICYRNHLRIKQCMCELLFSQKTILEVAKKNGITDSKFFYKKFKEIIGVSPSVFSLRKNKNR